MVKIDLYLHTTISDGKLTPVDIVKLAKKKGLQVIAVADHDSIRGIRVAIRAGKKIGLKVIPAIEISCHWQNERIHMLGFGIDINNKSLTTRLKKFNRWRRERALKVIKKLSQIGFKICFSDLVKEVRGSIGRPHIARAVLAYQENRRRLKKKMRWGEFIEEYLVEGKPAFVKKKMIDAIEAIELIHRAGGLAIWAHPSYYTPDKRKILAFLKDFRAAGLDGLEVFFRSHHRPDVQFLHQLVERFNLCETAGSDFHDPKIDKLGGFKTFNYSLDGVWNFIKKF